MNMYEEYKQFKFTPFTLALPLYTVLLLWMVYWFEVTFGYNFTKYGIYPRTFSGLRGILFSPFIHSGIKHLFNNSVPLFVLLISLFYFYKDIAFKILFYGLLLSGFLTWIIARDAYHIGASGIVYLLFSFILFSGIIRRYIRLIAVSLMVVFLYGSMIWFIFPVKEEISWEGHLSGFLVGIVFALVYRNYGPQKTRFHWEEAGYVDEESIMLDENGNFIDLQAEEEE
tara:strand:- start:47672 stop:48352 length:681 start_codon:yes stop_codon:yes gene_type:complete